MFGGKNIVMEGRGRVLIDMFLSSLVLWELKKLSVSEDTQILHKYIKIHKTAQTHTNTSKVIYEGYVSYSPAVWKQTFPTNLKSFQGPLELKLYKSNPQ